MKLFISWSGDRSKAVAEALRKWLPNVIQTLEPWVSFEDIEKGSRWGVELSSELDKTQIGIICLTRENINAPWILFEAGTLAKSVEKALVCPYLLDLKPNELPSPLVQFQATSIDKQETLKLLRTINKANSEKQLSEKQLDDTFERWWTDLENSLKSIPEPHEDEMKKMVKEFEAYEIADDKRLDLNLLPEPIHKYTDPERKIEYGVIFAFALEKNPEVFLTFEKYTELEGLSCELVRIGGGEMHVIWNGKEIWKSGPGGGKPFENISSSYISFWYRDLETGKPLDYFREAIIKPQITYLNTKPLLIDGVEDVIEINPDFLEWEDFSILFWAQVTRDFLDTQDNKYLFSYTSDPKDNNSYPNGFYFGIRFLKWNLTVKGSDPNNETSIVFPASEIDEGWNLFSIILQKTYNNIKLNTKNINSENKFETKEASIVPDSLPNIVLGCSFTLGDWIKHHNNVISSINFYKFRIYKDMLSDEDIDYIFRSERNIVQKFS